MRIENDTIDDITSTQNMIQDSRARRQLKGKNIICEKCEFTTRSMTLLNTHMKQCSKTVKNNMKSKRIHCNNCDKKFNKEATFRTHMKNIHHELNETIYNNQIKEAQSNLTFPENTRKLRSYKKLDSAQVPNN